MGPINAWGADTGQEDCLASVYMGDHWQPDDEEDENEEPEYPWELLSPYAGDVAAEDGDDIP